MYLIEEENKTSKTKIYLVRPATDTLDQGHKTHTHEHIHLHSVKKIRVPNLFFIEISTDICNQILLIVDTERTCCEELSSVFKVHCTAAGNASFMRAADRGTGDDLTRVSNMSRATYNSIPLQLGVILITRYVK